MEKRGVFPEIPMMEGTSITMSAPENSGDGNYTIIFEGTTKKDYDAYLTTLTEMGYEKFADNGEGLAGVVFQATYTKDKWAVTVIHVKKQKKTYLSICYDQPLSERLIYKKEYASGIKPDACTKLHMMELWWFGNSFVIQLKNGHFIISDGGWYFETAYLVDYLEALVPKGEKPVVEAWLVSHAHVDHCGVFRELGGEFAERIYVEGIYYSVVSDELYKKDQGTRVDTAFMKLAATRLRNVDGKPTKFYRPHTGQRLYFSDITVDVLHTHEELWHNDATGDINDTSTWFMLNIEGQKCLLTGDGEKGSMKTIMATYDRAYLDVDVMTLMHHGFNTNDEFTDYCKVKTLLLTVRDKLPVCRANENNYLKENVEEYFAWGDGTKVLTFPYTIGNYETLPNNKWKYHDPSTRREQPNLNRYFTPHKKKEIRALRINDNGMTNAGATLLDRVQEHFLLPITEDGMMIELKIDHTLEEQGGYRIRLEDPTGWVIRGINEETLSEAIKQFVEDAQWSDKGFVAKETE